MQVSQMFKADECRSRDSIKSGIPRLAVQSHSFLAMFSQGHGESWRISIHHFGCHFFDL